MNLFNIEAGPWGGLVLVALVALSVIALYFTSWIVSGMLFVILILVPIAAIVYFGGRRVSRRLVHGGKR